MNNDEQPKNYFQTGVWVLVIAIIAYNSYLGVAVKKLGIPGIFEIEFGEKQSIRPEPIPRPPPSPPSTFTPKYNYSTTRSSGIDLYSNVNALIATIQPLGQ